jgi:hypothetical protein
VAAPLWEARRQRGGGGGSGTNNQQSTKSTMTMETKTMAATWRDGDRGCGVSAADTAAAAWTWRPAWQRGNGNGGMATVEAAPQAVTFNNQLKERLQQRRKRQ